MKTLYILILNLISVSIAEVLPPKDVTTVDIVLSRLKDQSWSEDERPCLEQTLSVLKNVRNYTVWAFWIWNSMHHPVGTFFGSEYSLGNYDQCLNVPSRAADPKIITQYCLSYVTLTGEKYEGGDRNVLGSTGPYLTTKTAIGRDLNRVIWGTCLPSTCKAGSISKIMKTIYLANPLTPSVPEITVNSCQVAGEKTEYSFGFYAFITLITMLLAASILSTCYLQCSTTKFGVIHDIADAFSMKRNWTSLRKKSNEEIGILNLLKVAIATLAVLGHTSFFKAGGPISNGVHFDEIVLETGSPFLNSLKHIDLVIDNFLMVSGLLLVKGFMEKKKTPEVALTIRYFRLRLDYFNMVAKQFMLVTMHMLCVSAGGFFNDLLSQLEIYIKPFISYLLGCRVSKLTASFAVVMFYVVSVSMYTGDGPVWQKFVGREQKACADNWWLGLMMLNNYVNSENICLMVSWYIPCDYQLSIMGTILYLIWQKNRTMGQVVTTITVILALLIPGVVTYWKKLPGMIVFHDLEQILDIRKNEVYLDTYIRSHNRAGPYLTGMAMGYIISIYKPNNYRNVISKELLVLLFAAASIVTLKVLTEPLSWVTLEYDHLSSALYAVFSKNLLALCTCVTIGIVEYGDIATIRKFTSWHGFTILSRLTYGIYLTHSVILHQNMYSRRNLKQFDLIYSESLRSLGVIMMSLIFATLLWMFVEAPLNNIVNLVIKSGSKDQSRNQRTKYELETTGFEDAKIKQS